MNKVGVTYARRAAPHHICQRPDTAERSVALVTGANRGFGRQLTAQLAARGAAKVYAAARKPETVTTAVVIPIRIDVTDPASVAAAAAASTDVTLLINNAGTFSFNGLLTGPLDDIREQMEIHYFGTLTVTRVFAPCLRANAPAAILNVLSVRPKPTLCVMNWRRPASR